MFALHSLSSKLRSHVILYRSFLNTYNSVHTPSNILVQIQRARFPTDFVEICKQLSFEHAYRKDSDIWSTLYYKLDNCEGKLTSYQIASIVSSLSKSGQADYLHSLEKRILEVISNFKSDQLAFVIIAYGKWRKGSEDLWKGFGTHFINNPTNKNVVFINALFHLIKNDKDFLQYEEHIIELLNQTEIDSQGVASLINASSTIKSDKLFAYMLELFPKHLNTMKDLDFVISLHSISKLLKSIEYASVISDRIMKINDLKGKETTYLLNALFNFEYYDRQVVGHVLTLMNPKLKELTTRELCNAFHYISSFPDHLRFHNSIERAYEEMLVRKDLTKDLKGMSSAFHTLKKLSWNPVPLLKFVDEELLKALTGDQLCVIFYSVYQNLPMNHHLIPLLIKYALIKSPDMHGKHLLNLGYIMINDAYFDIKFWTKFLPYFNKWKQDFVLTEDNELSMASQLLKIKVKLRYYNLVD